jgi:nitrate reductase gamma subunit
VDEVVAFPDKLAVLLLMAPVVLGAGATYFAPSRLRTKAVFFVSVAFVVIGILVLSFAVHATTQIEQMHFRSFETGMHYYADYDRRHSFGRWVDFSLVGALLALFGMGCCLGLGLRKMMNRGRG